MSDLDLLRAELARYTYRPGWEMSIETRPTDGWPELRIQFTAIDSRDPSRWILIPTGQTIPVDLRYPGPPSWRKDFGRWLRAALTRIEEHEAREWFRRDGVLVDDPHAGGRNSL